MMRPPNPSRRPRRPLPLNLDYARLSPGAVLDALDGAGFRGDGRLLQLNSFENRVFLVHMEDGDAVVAKFYRPGRWSDAQILEEHRFALDLAAAEVPAVPPLALNGGSTLGHHDGLRFSVSPKRGGRAPELEDPEVLTALGRFLAQIHRVGRERPFSKRLHWASREPGDAAAQFVIDSGLLPPDVEPKWLGVVERCLSTVQAAFDSLYGLRLQRLHGDCHPGNLLCVPGGATHFVDLDDAVTGPAVQDLWMLLGKEPWQLACLLDGYEQVLDFDRRELRLIEPLRTLRMIHHSGWIAKRWDDPAFPAAFPWFGTPNYWMDQTALLAEQLEAMQDAAPVAAPPKDDDGFVDFDGDGFA